MKKNILTSFILILLSISSFAQMRITEFMYSGVNGEFIEFTNVGNTAINMSGWSSDDSNRNPGVHSLTSAGIVQPGESIILTETAVSTFRSAWGLCAGIKIIGGYTNDNLARSDEINLYDASNNLVDRLTYNDQGSGNVKGPRTDTKSAWVNAAGLGANNASVWTLSTVGGSEAGFTSAGGDIGSPGKSTRATVVFNPCAVVNGAPTIVMDVTNTSNYLDGGITTAPSSPYGISGAVSDPTDPARTLGIQFTINDDVTPIASLTVTANSSNTAVVPLANLDLTGSGNIRNIKITPAAVGYSTITITVNDGTTNTSYIISYAASAAAAIPANTVWPTGISDASNAIALDDNYYITGDDELNLLNVYSRSASGLPLKSYDYTSNLSLPDPAKPEVDLEAATRSIASPNKIFWLGSMSNGKDPFDNKPNRNRLFATTVSGTGASTAFTFAGYYGNLRARLITWGDANGYNFTASAAAGVDSKAINGFAAEGLVFGPDNTTLYIGLRAPLVPTANRTKAVIAPILNFETWFNNGAPSGNPTFGSPIELNLGNRGIRDLIRLSNGTYIIVAGNYAGDPVTGAIYKWTGNASDAPVLVNSAAAASLAMEGAMQVNISGQLSLTNLQVVTDKGGDILYNDGTEAKDLSDLHLRKFRLDNLNSLDLGLCQNTSATLTQTACNNYVWYGTTYTTSGTYTHITTNAAGCDSAETLNLTIHTTPAQPGTFTQKTTFVYKGQTAVAYSVPAMANTNYVWSFSGTGATINGIGNSVTVDFSAAATSGALSVSANNATCGNGPARTLAIVLNDPINVPTANYDYSFVTVGCNRVDYLDTTFTSGDPDYSCGASTANVYQLKRLFTEIQHLNPLPKYLFMTGDIVMGYINDTVALAHQLTSWRQIYESHPLFATGIQLVVIPGNHETQDKVAGKKSFTAAERTFVRIMAPYIKGSNGPGIGGPDGLTTDQSKLTYSFDNGNDHFIIINTDPVGKDGIASYKWIANDIQNARANHARHIFAFGHKPAYSSPVTPQGGLDAPATLAARDSLWKYLEQFNCEAMFSAHEHLWDSIHPHNGKTWQVINGNGGTRVEPAWVGPGKQYYGYTLVNLYTDRKVNVMGLGRNTDMSPTVGQTPYTVNEDANPTTIRNNFNICLTTTSSQTVTACNSYLWNGTTYNTSGTYNHTTTNVAGCDSVETLNLTIKTIPSQPGAFTASTAYVSMGQTGVIYTVPNDPAVTTYAWSYSGTGATINGTGNSVSINFSAVATGGTLSVTATNSCGTSTQRSMVINIQTSFSAGNLVVLQTSNTASKIVSPITLKEITTTGAPRVSVTLPSTGTTPFQTAGIFGGSEGFLTTSTDGKFLVLSGYSTTATAGDITATAASAVPRAVGVVYPSGYFQQVGSSTINFSNNDIRGAISDGTNFWASGASVSNIDGIDYYGPGTPAGLGTGTNPPKAYGMRIFNGQIYYSTQKAGPSNSVNQLGIFSFGSGSPVSGNPTPTQIINTGTIVVEDFSINPVTTVCYIAVNLNSSVGGIQKWVKTGSNWSFAYTLKTGIVNTGAYGLVVDYSGSNPIIYATTFDAAGNRVIKITDDGTFTGSGSSAVGSSPASTIVAAVPNVFYKGISFAPVPTGAPLVNLNVSTNTASEANTTVVTVTATTTEAVSGNQTINLAVSGTNITNDDYTLSDSTITIPAGATSGSVTFTVTDDAISEALVETATLTISNPSPGITLGTIISQPISITDNEANVPPTIVMNVASTTNFIDNAATTSPASPYSVSGTTIDPTDPASTLGIDFTIGDLETAVGDLTVTITSNNNTVVPPANINLTGTGASRNIKITAVGVGYANITITVSDGINASDYVINYAASSSAPVISAPDTYWHTGISDASDGVAQDDNYYMSGDDELDLINVYSRTASGLPVKSFDVTSFLNLPDPGKPEMDTEAGAKSPTVPNKTYWLGSMSNGKAPFDNKPNRDRLFATTHSGTGETTSLSVTGYCAIKTTLLIWGDANGYNFSASAAAGVDSKSLSGFAAEGMAFAPDNTTLWIGLRAPLVPTTNRTKAVLAPILNFETWFNNGSPVGNPTFGAPIELDLNIKGIRDITRLSNGTYVIVAGSADDAGISEIYKWSGNIADAPIHVTTPANGIINMEGAMEVHDNGNLSLTSLQVISDGGDATPYGDNILAKDFGDLHLRKFRSDRLTNIDLVVIPCQQVVSTITSTSSTTFCPGDSVILTAPDSMNAYTWSNGATTRSITVHSQDNYTVTVNKHGCIDTSAITATSIQSLNEDINSDGVVSNSDLNNLLLLFGQSCNCHEDINKDGKVSNADLNLLLIKFGMSCNGL
jgi:hypothetical protein